MVQTSGHHRLYFHWIEILVILYTGSLIPLVHFVIGGLWGKLQRTNSLWKCVRRLWLVLMNTKCNLITKPNTMCDKTHFINIKTTINLNFNDTSKLVWLTRAERETRDIFHSTCWLHKHICTSWLHKVCGRVVHFENCFCNTWLTVVGTEFTFLPIGHYFLPPLQSDVHFLRV